MNPEWVEAGARAYANHLGSELEPSSGAWDRGVAAAVIAAVEPLIRADERERNREAEGVELYLATEHAEAVAARLVEVICEQEAEPRCRTCGIRNVRAQIAADIEAHYSAPNGDVGPSDYDEGLHTAALLARGSCGFVDCLACARIARGGTT